MIPSRKNETPEAREKRRISSKSYYERVTKHKVEARESSLADKKEKRLADVEGARERERQKYRENREAICKRKRLYNKQPHVREKLRIAKRKCYKKNIGLRLVDNIRNRHYFVLKGRKKSARTMELLGCTREELLSYLEHKFTPGMTWDNYGFGDGKWSLDHIKPLSHFNLKNEEEWKIAGHYTNLQPMWCVDNFSKGNRYVG